MNGVQRHMVCSLVCMQLTWQVSFWPWRLMNTHAVMSSSAGRVLYEKFPAVDHLCPPDSCLFPLQ